MIIHASQFTTAWQGTPECSDALEKVSLPTARAAVQLALASFVLAGAERSALQHLVDDALLTVPRSQVPGRERDQNSLLPWQMRRVDAFVSAHLACSIRVSELAALARLSSSYFSKCFTATTGQSPHEYVMRQRIERAKQMMIETDEPMGQISVACGLADQAHLSRLFRRFVGETPRTWRRRQRCTG